MNLIVVYVFTSAHYILSTGSFYFITGVCSAWFISFTDIAPFPKMSVYQVNNAIKNKSTARIEVIVCNNLSFYRC